MQIEAIKVEQRVFTYDLEMNCVITKDGVALPTWIPDTYGCDQGSSICDNQTLELIIWNVNGLQKIVNYSFVNSQ